MNHIFVTLVIFYCYTTKVENVKFQVILENMTHCDQPQPPLSYKKTVLLDFKVTKSKEKNLLTGRNTVLAEVPFRNFSFSCYNIDENGKKERWLNLENMSCRNFLGKTFLVFGLIQYNKANCVLQRGSSEFKDLDIDKLSHKIPLQVQRGEGRLLYRSQLVADGCTVFCLDTMVSIKVVK